MNTPTLARRTRTIEERFWPKVDQRSSDECWPWTAGLTQAGYGQIHESGRGRRNLMAHRVAYELLVGPIPDGLHIDHLCRNRACVNPAHMEPVANRENALRGEHPNVVLHKTQRCKNGHAVTGDNAKPRGDGRFICRECSNRRWRDMYHQKMERAS